MSVKEKIERLLEQLNKGIFEKEEAIALALLSSIARESIFLLGPPGVAKSLIARRLKFAYKGSDKEQKVFEYLMSRFSTPDEIFGPVSISKLKNEDKYERITKNYLPSADIVFLDEIWKAGPSIQNTLLTVINEKKFRNGDTEIDVPMKALISASNELPAKDEGLEALWDRFLIRLYVSGIEDEDKFSKMISESLNPYEDPVTDANKITEEEYKKWSKKIDDIEIPDNVFKVINIIRKKIAVDNDRDDKKDNEEGNAENRGKIAGDNKREDKEENAENRKEIAGDNKREDKKGNMENPIYISDRRWRKIIRLLRASAFLNDRNEVDLMDCFLIQHCIWNELTERDMAYQFVRDAIEKHGYTVSFDFESLKQELDEFKLEIDEETKFVKDTRVPVLKKIYDDYYEMEGMPTNCNLIKQSDFNSLTDDNVSKYLYYWHNNYKRVEQYNNNSYHSLGHGSSFDLRKGNAEFSVFVDDTEYQLKMVVQGDKRQNTKKPHPSVEKDWDERVTQYLQKTAEWLEQIEAYRNKDLEHLRTNIFVKPELANIVESHIDATKKDIEKIKVTIREIQNGYKKLKDEEVVIDDDK